MLDNYSPGFAARVDLLFPMSVFVVSIEILIATLRTPHRKVKQDPAEGICAHASASRR